MANGSPEKSCAPLAAASYRGASTSRRAIISRVVNGSPLTVSPQTQHAS
jgi:hypothetical protein